MDQARLLDIVTTIRRGETVTIPVNGEREGYSVAVGPAGVTFYSECCADSPSLDEVRQISAALGFWLERQESPAPQA